MHVALMPADRRNRQRRRTIFLAWGTGLAAWCLAWAGVVAVSSASARSIDEVAAAADASRAELAGVEAAQSLATSELEAVLATLRASSAVVEQVDWSRLVGAVAAATGEDVVLRRYTLETPANPEEDAAPSGTADGAIVLDLAAYARTSRAMSAFTLALEDTRLFDRVRLVDTRRQPVGTGAVVAFRLECHVGGRGPAEPAR